MVCSTRIFFRANAYPEIGTGHVMRCLSLANAFSQAQAATCFVGRIDDAVLRDWIGQRGHGLALLPQESAFDAAQWPGNMAPRPGDWVVLDGYGFDADDHAAIVRSGARLMVVDDMPLLDSYDVDMILNQNFYADALRYPCRATTRLLLGPKFSLLRESFSRDEALPAVAGQARRLLVSLGGSDPDGIGMKIIAALENIGDMALDVLYIAGPSNPHLDRIGNAVVKARAAGHRIEVCPFTEDMPGAMRWADMCIIAAGSTTLEVAYMGVPCLVTILAENQRPIAEAMARSGAARLLGWGNQLDVTALADALRQLAADAPARSEMRANGRALVDGQGAKRVVTEMMREM